MISCVKLSVILKILIPIRVVYFLAMLFPQQTGPNTELICVKAYISEGLGSIWMVLPWLGMLSRTMPFSKIQGRVGG